MTNFIIRPDTVAQVKAWNEVVMQCSHYDIYHTAEYHLVVQDQGLGDPALLVVEESSEIFALPLLVRSPDEIIGGKNKRDATSVYGYGGPITSLQSIPLDRQIWSKNVGGGLLKLMQQLGLVSCFTRLHPLIDSAWVIDSIGKINVVGPTVIIDLSKAEEEQQKEMRSNYRYVVRKMSRQGVQVIADPEWSQLDQFILAYEETMARVSASNTYFYDQQYFSSLRDRLNKNVRLFHAVLNDQIIGSSIFFTCNNIIQYHLGATFSAFTSHSPNAMILDFVRSWGMNAGIKWFHLGGGVGGKEDSVFRFKSGLSQDRRECFSAAIIIDQQEYDRLCTRRRRMISSKEDIADPGAFFPEYRLPLPTADG